MKKSPKENLELEIKNLFSSWVKLKPKLNKIRYAGPSFDDTDYHAMLDAIFSDWWSGGKYTLQAEEDISRISERKHSVLVNSGSSANLLLISAVKEAYGLNDGDKVVTISLGFPTTVNAIIQNRLIPVFVDTQLEDLSINSDLLEEVLKRDEKIKCLFIAHTLGFVGDITNILKVCEKYGVIPLFDCCDAYQSYYKDIPVQKYGVASTYSFYCPHNFSCGEGGGISTDDTKLHLTIRSMRNWGRWCSSNSCCIRSFNPELFCPTGKLTKDCDLPSDYIVNYSYEYLGFNLKMLDLQAAILSNQIKKSEDFKQKRIENFNYLGSYFSKQGTLKIHTWELKNGECPFSFPFILPEEINRGDLIKHYSKNNIETRLLFGGNLMRHPAYQNKKQYWESYGGHPIANKITERLLMLGVSQVANLNDIKRVTEVTEDFIKNV